MPAERADRVAVAIILHMQPSVTLADGVESVLLDRATGLDVRGDEFELVDAVRPGVMRRVPEAGIRPPLPRRDRTRGGGPPDLPERPAAARRPAWPAGWPVAVARCARRGEERRRCPAEPEARERYPAIEPYETGMLDVGDGQSIYWEVSGNPDGKPAVTLHGGPGSGSTPGWRRWFDPGALSHRPVRPARLRPSTPHASDLATDLSTNTTHHLIADIERLREHLGIERWLVVGASWGVTLGLAYAERFPERVSEMILLSITRTRRADVQWLVRDVGRYFPEEWARIPRRCARGRA